MNKVTLSQDTSRRVMLDAWQIARQAAKRYSHPASSFLVQALRQAWAMMKARRIAAQEARQARPTLAYTLCIDVTLNRSSKLRDLPAVDTCFISLAAAQAAKDALAKAFIKPFIKTAKTCFAA